MVKDKRRFLERTSINVAVNTTRTVLFALIGILMVPYYLDSLGVGAYGIIPLATSMSSYMMIITDSVSAACNRYNVIAIEQGNHNDAMKTFNSSLFGMVRCLMVLVPVMMAFAFLSPYIFKVSHGVELDVQLMMAMIMLSSVIEAFSTAFNGLLNAYNMMYRIHLSRIIYLIVQVGTIVLLFQMGTPSLVDVGIAYVISSLILLALVYVFAMRVSGDIHIDRKRFDWKTYKDIFRMAKWNCVSSLGNLLMLQASLVIVNISMGSAEGGLFAMVVSMVTMVNTFCLSITQVLNPLFYVRYADGGSEHLYGMIRMSMKVILCFTAFPIAFVLLFSDSIFTAWVGSEYAFMGKITSMAFIAELLYVSRSIVKVIPLTVNRMDVFGKNAVLNGVLNIILALIFVNFIDLSMESIIVAWVVSMMCLAFIDCVLSMHLVNRPWYAMVPQIACGYALMLSALLFLYILKPILPVMDSWLMLFLVFLPLFLVFVSLVFGTVITKDERRALSGLIPAKLRALMPAFMKGE